MKSWAAGLLCAAMTAGIAWLFGIDFNERGYALGFTAIYIVVVGATAAWMARL